MNYYFKENTLYFKKKALLKDISPWVNTRIKPHRSELCDKIILNLKDWDETRLRFESDCGSAQLTLSVREEGDSFALYLSGGYDSEGTWGHGTHLNPECGLGLDMGIRYEGNYVTGYMKYEYWQEPFISPKLSQLKPRTQILSYRRKDDKTVLMTVSDRMYKTELHPLNARRLSLIAQANTVWDSIDECVLVGACGEDELVLPEKAVAFGLKTMNKSGKLRREKKYPEIFEYLGWCSWDAFQCEVSADKLLQKAQEFREKDIPVRWMILDDTWCDVSCIDIPTMGTRELNDWEAPKSRFPKGLKAAVSDLKEQYGMKIGIWHPISGYWFGVNPLGPLARRIPELLEYTVPRRTPGARLVHSFDKKKAEKYYDLQHKFYADCGADFTKVDNQGSVARFAFLKGGIGECAQNLHSAIEKAAKKYYSGALINCMGMPIENFWNRGDTAVNRFSGDFQPENRKWFVRHIMECAYNCYSQGTVYVGDWDMFWSDDEQAKKNAVLRAMSGGPIYLSDKLDRSIREVIMPLAFSDGRIVRLADSPLPTRDCLYEDPQKSGKLFKLQNRHKDSGVLSVFNLDAEENPVSGAVSPSDVEGLTPGAYILYDWFSGKSTRVDYGEKIELELQNYDDFRLILFVPVKKGKAIIGLKEKYMSVAAVKKIKDGAEALDDGTLRVYSEEDLAGFVRVGDHLYEKQVKKGEVIRL